MYLGLTLKTLCDTPNQSFVLFYPCENGSENGIWAQNPLEMGCKISKNFERPKVTLKDTLGTGILRPKMPGQYVHPLGISCQMDVV